MPTSGRATKTSFNSEFFGFSPDFLFGSRQESGDFAKGAALSAISAHWTERAD
jgi:hypothetical protein